MALLKFEFLVPFTSSPRRLVSDIFNGLEIPAFAGMTKSNVLLQKGQLLAKLNIIFMDFN
jgi:hypothetical protein